LRRLGELAGDCGDCAQERYDHAPGLEGASEQLCHHSVLTRSPSSAVNSNMCADIRWSRCTDFFGSASGSKAESCNTRFRKTHPCANCSWLLRASPGTTEKLPASHPQTKPDSSPLPKAYSSQPSVLRRAKRPRPVQRFRYSDDPGDGFPSTVIVALQTFGKNCVYRQLSKSRPIKRTTTVPMHQPMILKALRITRSLSQSNPPPERRLRPRLAAPR
jgi:hypothetical protein